MNCEKCLMFSVNFDMSVIFPLPSDMSNSNKKKFTQYGGCKHHTHACTHFSHTWTHVRFRGLAVACWTTYQYHPCSNLGVDISEGCFIFDFASLPLDVARPI